MAEEFLLDFDKLWNYADPAGTERIFRGLLPVAQASGNPDYLGQLMTQIARAQGLQGRFRDGRVTLEQAARFFGVNNQPPSFETRYCLELGRLLNSDGDRVEALEWFSRAAVLAEHHCLTRHHIDAIHMMAIAVADPIEQVRWNREGIKLVEANPPQRGWLYALYNNLGESYAKLELYEEALGAFRKMAALDTAKGNEPGIYTLKDQSRMLRALGRFEEALAIIEPIARRLEREQKRDGWISEEYAECLFLAGRADEARPHFAIAYELLTNDPWVLKHDPLKLDRLRRMSGPSTEGD